MEKVNLAHDLSISRLVIGMWRLNEWNFSSEDLYKFIRQCIDMGITTFDHADIYGDYTCEQQFGKMLKDHPELREEMEIVTKCCIKLISKAFPDHKIKHYDSSKSHIIKSVDNSLQNLATDHIDLLLLHRPDPFLNPEEVAEAFKELEESGKVRHFGVSNYSPMQLEMLESYIDYDLVTNQIEISATCLDAFENETITHCQKRKMSPMAWSPLGGGSIFHSSDEKSKRVLSIINDMVIQKGGSTDQWLLAWLLAHPAKIIPVLGTGKIERVRTAAYSLSLPFELQEWFAIYQASLGNEVP
jgi:predicted oxidoreductase